MPDKRSKYDTDPLDPDFARHADESRGRTPAAPRPAETDPFRPTPVTEEQTRRFDEQVADSYPSVFVPPAYQPPRAPQPQPFAGFGAGTQPSPPARVAPPPHGPSSPYHAGGPPSSRPVARLGLPENFAVILPYFPFYIGLVAAIIELAMVPREETRTRFHAAQGLALQLAVVAGSILFQVISAVTNSGFGGKLFGLASVIFLIVSAVRVWQGRPHHIAPLDEPTRWLGERITPGK